MNYRQRIECLRHAMKVGNIATVIYGLGANYQYFTGSMTPWVREDEPAEPKHLLVVSVDAPPRVIVVGEDTREILPSGFSVTQVESRDELVAILPSIIKGQGVGVNKQAATYLSLLVNEALPYTECVEADIFAEELRLIKDINEIALLREAARLTDKAMSEMVGLIGKGITQQQLQQVLREVGLRLGAQEVSFPPAGLYVKSSTIPSEDPFVYPRNKGLVLGTSIAFDFGFVLNGYCSDFGRSFYYGSAPDHIHGAYRALQDSQSHLISKMKPGMRIGDMTAIILARLDKMGYGDRFRARLPCGTLGHQIGVELHENPWIRPSCDRVLAPGMVMCIEPKVWFPGEYYLRVEDMVLVTEDGAESLTVFDRGIFELYPTGA